MKKFNLLCNGSVLIWNRPMSFIKTMENSYKKMAQYRGCKFEIKYNNG